MGIGDDRRIGIMAAAARSYIYFASAVRFSDRESIA